MTQRCIKVINFTISFDNNTLIISILFTEPIGPDQRTISDPYRWRMDFSQQRINRQFLRVRTKRHFHRICQHVGCESHCWIHVWPYSKKDRGSRRGKNHCPRDRQRYQYAISLGPHQRRAPTYHLLRLRCIRAQSSSKGFHDLTVPSKFSEVCYKNRSVC